MSVMEESLLKLLSQKFEENQELKANQQLEKNTSSFQILKQKTLVWDSIILSIAFYIFGLSVSSIIVELFKSNENSVACFTSFENRGQNTYVNNYCHKHLPEAEYFPLMLVLQATLLIVPHYVWKACLSAEFGSFFSHVARVDILRKVNTGKYPYKNYTIVNYLQREFGDSKFILVNYGIKLFAQIIVVGSVLTVIGNVLGEPSKGITFECSDDDNQIFDNVMCAYPRLLFSNVLLGIDYGLLALAVIMLAIGLYWVFFWNHSTNQDNDEIAKFCYKSCIDAQYGYKSPKGCNKFSIGWCRMRSDFSFLIASLHSGLQRVFRTIQIEDLIFKQYSEALQKWVPGK